MKKTFYAYGFWWLVPIVLFFIGISDLYMHKGIPEIRTPSALLLVYMLFFFGFPHKEVMILSKLNENLVKVSKRIFHLSILITICVVVHMMGSNEKIPNLFNLKIINFLVCIFFVINFFLFLKVKRK